MRRTSTALNDARSDTAKGCAVWVNGTVEETEDIIRQQRYHFTVGDSTDTGWQFLQLQPKNRAYLNIAAVESLSIYYDETVRGATLLPVAPFTINAW